MVTVHATGEVNWVWNGKFLLGDAKRSFLCKFIKQLTKKKTDSSISTYFITRLNKFNAIFIPNNNNAHCKEGKFYELLIIRRRVKTHCISKISDRRLVCHHAE